MPVFHFLRFTTDLEGAAPRRVLYALLALNLGLLCYYIVADYQFALHSDAAVKNLLAQEIHETGRFFPPDWTYVNGDLWVWYPHALLLPLLRWFPNGFALHAVAGLITAALVLMAAAFLGRLAGLGRNARLLLLVLLTCGIAPNMAENLYGQAGYGTMFYMAAFPLYAAWRSVQADGRRWPWRAVLALLTLLVFWSNPQRAAVYNGLPLGMALLAMLPLRAAGLRLRSIASTLGVLVLAASAGVWLHQAVLPTVHSTAGLSVVQWVPFHDMARNALGTVQGLLSLLGGIPDPGGKLLSSHGAADALRLLAAVVLLCLLPRVLLDALDWRAPGRFFLGVATLCSLGACLFLNVSTNIPVQDSPEASIRYVVPGLLAALVLLCGHLFAPNPAAPVRRGLLAAALAVLALSGIRAYALPLSPGYVLPGELDAANPKQRLLHFLQQQGLRYGYATFWNAGQYSVMSGGTVLIRQLELKQGMLHPFRHLASDRWFQPEAWDGPSFLLLGSEEAAVLDWTALQKAAGTAPRRLDFEGWQIWVFPRNLAALQPHWDLQARQPFYYRADAAAPHTTGAYDSTLGGLLAGPGAAGALAFGQQRRLAPGKYQASFDIVAEGAAGTDFGMLDVVSDAGRSVHARALVKESGTRRVVLEFTLAERTDNLEFRAISNGGGNFGLRGIELVRASAAQ